MKHSVLHILFLFVLLWANDNYVVMTEEFPPFGYYSEGKLKGYGVEVVDAVLKEIEWNSTIKVYPWARAYNDIQTQEKRILFLMARTEAREKLFQWAGPLFKDTVSLYQRSDSPDTILSLDEARSVERILVNRGFPQHDFLEARGFDNLYLTVNPQQDLKMIGAKRGDIFIIGQAALSELLKEEEYQSLSIKRIPVHLMVIELYVAFSLDVDPAVVQLWNDAIDTLKAQGVMKEIHQRYFHMSQ